MVCNGSVTGRQRILTREQAIPIAVMPYWGFCRAKPPLTGPTSLSARSQLTCLHHLVHWPALFFVSNFFPLARFINQIYKLASCPMAELSPQETTEGCLVSLSQLDSAAHRPGSGGDKVHPAA